MNLNFFKIAFIFLPCNSLTCIEALVHKSFSWMQQQAFTIRICTVQENRLTWRPTRPIWTMVLPERAIHCKMVSSQCIRNPVIVSRNNIIQYYIHKKNLETMLFYLSAILKTNLKFLFLSGNYHCAWENSFNYQIAATEYFMVHMYGKNFPCQQQPDMLSGLWPLVR